MDANSACERLRPEDCWVQDQPGLIHSEILSQKKGREEVDEEEEEEKEGEEEEQGKEEEEEGEETGRFFNRKTG